MGRLQDAWTKCKHVERPHTIAQVGMIAALRESGRHRGEIYAETDLTKGTAQRTFHSLPRTELAAIRPMS